jgi:hypothetical protein
MISQLCPSNCDTAERFNLSGKVVPQATLAQAGLVVLDATARLLVPDAALAWSSGGSHAPPAACAASFSVLRI